MTSTNPAREFDDLSTENAGTNDGTQTLENQPDGADASFMDQETPALSVEEKDSTLEFIPTSSHICEGVECDAELQTSTADPAFADEPRAGQDQTDPETEEDKSLHEEDQEQVLPQRSSDPEELMPALVITQPDEVCSEPLEDVCSSLKPEDVIHAASSETDLSGSDLLSFTSDTLSLMSETAISCKSDEQEGPEEDTRSVAASSVLSLFHRVQMEPMEREWMRCSALGNATTLYLLLQQDPTLVSKKTALHWAAKQGREETVDMMARRGADVNQRSGYTALHLASIHGHERIIQLLINNYNARVNVRDYHGKTAAHYWSGSMEIFTQPRSHTAGSWPRGRRGQCYAQLSVLLSRSQSNRSISGETVENVNPSS